MKCLWMDKWVLKQIKPELSLEAKMIDPYHSKLWAKACHSPPPAVSGYKCRAEHQCIWPETDALLT